MGVDADGRIASFHEKPAHAAADAGAPGPRAREHGHLRLQRGLPLRAAASATPTRPARATISARTSSRTRWRAGIACSRTTSGDSCVNMSEGIPYWRDVGTVDAYWEANMELTKVTPPLNLYDQDWPIWTYQEQLPPAKFVFDDDGRRGMAIDSMVSGGCIISGSLVRRSLLFSNVRVHSFCTVEDSVVLPERGGASRRRAPARDRRPRVHAARGHPHRRRPRRGPQALPRHRARRRAGDPGDARPAGAPRALGWKAWLNRRHAGRASDSSRAAVAHAPAGLPRPRHRRVRAAVGVPARDQGLRRHGRAPRAPSAACARW